MKQVLVSVIVPTYNNSSTIGACLSSIANQAYSEIEIIVIDNSSIDDTKMIARGFTDKVFDHGPERSAQRNYGVSKSLGEYVLIVDSDMQLSPNVVSSCVTAIHPAGIKAVVIPEESFGEGFWAACKKLERSFYVGIKWMEAARFFSREVFDEVKGYDELNTGTEDYDLSQRIEAQYGHQALTRINDLIFHDEGRINIFKSCKKKFYYTQCLDIYKKNTANTDNLSKQSSPVERYKLFFSSPNKLFRDPLVGMGMLIMKTAEFGAGAIGYLFFEAKVPKGAMKKMISDTPLSLVVFMVGPMNGISGGDVHALKLATYWSEHPNNTTVIAPAFLKHDIDLAKQIEIISPKIILEKKLESNLVFYPLLVLFRLVKYVIYSPEAEVSVAASHLFGDVIASLIHSFRYKSQPVIYVHHILALVGRPSTLRSKISIGLESISLTLAKRYSALIIVSNAETKRELIKQGFSSSLIYESANGVEKISRSFEYNATNPSSLHLVFCGRLTEEKGIWDILTVAKHIKYEFPFVHIEVIGDGPLRLAVEEKIKTEGLNNVSILGYVTEEYKWSLLGRARLFLAPSREEGWGIAIDEALAAGTPVVAYNLSAYNRLGKAIIKVDSVGNATIFAEAVKAFLNNPQQQQIAIDSVSDFYKLEWKEIIDLEAKFILDKFKHRAYK